MDLLLCYSAKDLAEFAGLAQSVRVFRCGPCRHVPGVARSRTPSWLFTPLACPTLLHTSCRNYSVASPEKAENCQRVIAMAGPSAEALQDKHQLKPYGASCAMKKITRTVVHIGRGEPLPVGAKFAFPIDPLVCRLRFAWIAKRTYHAFCNLTGPGV